MNVAHIHIYCKHCGKEAVLDVSINLPADSPVLADTVLILDGGVARCTECSVLLMSS